MNFRILIAEDEEITLKQLLYVLKKEGYECVGARNGLEALDLADREHFDLLITDIKMPGMSGIELLENVRERFPGIEVLIITGFASIDSAVEAMKKGACDYISKPFNLDELLLRIRNLHERKHLKRENTALKSSFGIKRESVTVARSEGMRLIIDEIEKMSESNCNILLSGEHGTGKRHLAGLIHTTGCRRTRPLLYLDCTAMSEEEQSEALYGKCNNGDGITGAIEAADGGTLFLDGISELSVSLQPRLLRVIENNVLARNREERPRAVNIRFISSTVRNMKSLVAEGRFMEELNYRLNAMEIFVPPLRERREDILPLAEFFLQKKMSGLSKNIEGFMDSSKELLMKYSYPGNVRELENIIERAVILERGSLLSPESLPRSIKLFQIETFSPDRIMTMDELTKEYAEKVIGLVNGEKGKAAELLGISEIQLWRILKRNEQKEPS